MKDKNRYTLGSPLTGQQIWLVEQSYYKSAVCSSQGQASEQPGRRGSRSNPACMDTWHVTETGPRQGARAGSAMHQAGTGKHLCWKAMIGANLTSYIKPVPGSREVTRWKSAGFAWLACSGFSPQHQN